MSKTIHMTLDPASIQAAIREIEAYKKWVLQKTQQLAQRLAEMGAVLASIEYSRVPYTGAKDVSVDVVDMGENKFAIVAGGATVLILEFGAGIKYGKGHPLESEMGMGAGTYPGQTHALDPNGWYSPGGEHTYGNPPAMAMYLTGKELHDRVFEVAKEVFQ